MRKRIKKDLKKEKEKNYEVLTTEKVEEKVVRQEEIKERSH